MAKNVNGHTSRKRKRPTYLDDFYEENEEVSSSKRFPSSTINPKKCALCNSPERAAAIAWDLRATTGPARNILGNILSKVFEKENMSKFVGNEPSFEDGYLCQGCKALVSELDRFQHEVKKLRLKIIDIFKKGKVMESLTSHMEKINGVHEDKNIEKIIHKRINRDDKVEYLIKCKNEMGQNHSYWELEDRLSSVKHLIKAYENSLPVNHTKILPGLPQMKLKRGKKAAVIDRMDHKFLVRWDDYPHSEDTWELRSSIPPHLIKEFECKENAQTKSVHSNIIHKDKERIKRENTQKPSRVGNVKKEKKKHQSLKEVKKADEKTINTSRILRGKDVGKATKVNLI